MARQVDFWRGEMSSTCVVSVKRQLLWTLVPKWSLLNLALSASGVRGDFWDHHMSSQMVLFGQMLINKNRSHLPKLRLFLKASFHLPKWYWLYKKKCNGGKPTMAVCILPSVLYAVFFFSGNFIKCSVIAPIHDCLFGLKKSILEVAYPPICKRTKSLLRITGGGGGGCVFDRKWWSWTSCPVKKRLWTVLYLCNGIVVCAVICLLEEFIWKPHILSHWNGFLLDWVSYRVDLLWYLRRFCSRETKKRHLD